MGATPTQALSTLRDLDELGIAEEALAARPLRQKRNALRSASGIVASSLWRKHQLPMAISVVDGDPDTYGLTLGATATLAGTPLHVADVVVRIVDGGPVSGGACTYQVSLDAGASGPRVPGGADVSTFGPVVTMPASGVVAVDGVTLTLAGTLADDDEVTWSTAVDEGVKLLVVWIAAFILLGNRGVDTETKDALQRLYDLALKRLDQVADGVQAQLAPNADATPDLDEGGPYGDGDQDPWDWQDRAAKAGSCGC